MLESEARESIADLLVRLRPFVERRLGAAADVDDVLQDVFLRIHRGLPGLRDAERFGPWIYRLVRNAITDRHRTRARSTEPLDDTLAAGDDPPDADAAEGLASCIAPFVARLPSPYREAVTLVDLEGIAQKDAAAILGISVPGVKSRVQRGRKKLRAMFGECCRLELDARRRVVGFECRPGKDPRCGEAC